MLLVWVKQCNNHRSILCFDGAGAEERKQFGFNAGKCIYFFPYKKQKTDLKVNTSCAPSTTNILHGNCINNKYKVLATERA